MVSSSSLSSLGPSHTSSTFTAAIARRTRTSCTEATAAPSAPKLKLTALISVRPPGTAANTAVTASMEVREAATRAAAIPVEVMIAVIRAAGTRARTPERSSSLDILKPTSMPKETCSSPLVPGGVATCGSPTSAPPPPTAPATPIRAPKRIPAGTRRRLPK